MPWGGYAPHGADLPSSLSIPASWCAQRSRSEGERKNRSDMSPLANDGACSLVGTPLVLE